MTRTSRAFALLVLFSLLQFTTPSRADDVKVRVKKALERNELRDLTAAPENEKSALREELRKSIQANPFFARSAKQALVMLGDPETLEQYVHLFNEGRERREWRTAARVLRLANEPTVIARVAGQLSNQESSDEILDGDRLMQPRSVFAAGIIVSIGAKAPQFPISVRERFQSMQTYSAAELRTAVRQWWAANKAAFTSGKYDRVVPPPQ